MTKIMISPKTGLDEALHRLRLWRATMASVFRTAGVGMAGPMVARSALLYAGVDL